jgi:hypothetical protein
VKEEGKKKIILSQTTNSTIINNPPTQEDIGTPLIKNEDYSDGNSK